MGKFSKATLRRLKEEQFKAGYGTYTYKQRMRRTGYNLLKIMTEYDSTPLERHISYYQFMNICGINIGSGRSNSDSMKQFLIRSEITQHDISKDHNDIDRVIVLPKVNFNPRFKRLEVKENRFVKDSKNTKRKETPR